MYLHIIFYKGSSMKMQRKAAVSLPRDVNRNPGRLVVPTHGRTHALPTWNSPYITNKAVREDPNVTIRTSSRHRLIELMCKQKS